MSQLFNTILYRPLLNLLVFFYNAVPGNDIGLAIVCLTLVIKLALFPLSFKSIKAQKALRDLQPKIDSIKKKYKDKKEEMGKAMMALYKNEKVSPFSSCLPVLLQLPFLIAVYRVFRSGLNSQSLEMLYPFMGNPGSLNPVSLGLVDLSKPNIVLAVLAGIAQFFVSKMMVTKKPPREVEGSKGAKDEAMTGMINKQMMYMMPAFTIFIGLSLPGGLTLYWLITTLLMIVQQWYVFKKTGDAPGKRKEIVVEAKK